MDDLSYTMPKPYLRRAIIVIYIIYYFINFYIYSWIICIFESGSSRSSSKQIFTVTVVSELYKKGGKNKTTCGFLISGFGFILQQQTKNNIWTYVGKVTIIPPNHPIYTILQKTKRKIRLEEHQKNVFYKNHIEYCLL